MGNKTPAENQQGLVGHERLGLIRLAPNPEAVDEDCKELMIVSNKQASKSELSKWHDQIKLYKLQSISEYLLLPVGEDITSGGYCGANCHIDLKYPSYTIVLREEIKNRWKIDKMYEETELWYLLYNLALVGRHFEIMKVKMGNPHPTNILINGEGWMKVMSLYSLPGEKDNFSKICESQLEDVFLAPEQIDYDCIKRNHYPGHIDCNQAELFSIGMTVLEAASLELSTYTYDKGPYRPNFSKIKDNLTIVREKYSGKFYNILESLVSEHPKDRITCSAIFDMLRPFQTEILAMEPFLSKAPTDTLLYSRSNNSVMNQTTLINLNQSASELAETKIIYPSQSQHRVGSSMYRPMPINQPRERPPPPPVGQIRFYSPDTRKRL